MKTTVLALTFLLAAGAAVQDRVKKLTPDDLPKLLTSASKSLDGKRYAACARDLRSALGVLAGLVRQQLLATMPAAPEGFTAEPDPEGEDAGAFAAMIGVVAPAAERTWRRNDGDGELRVSITPDAPMAPMLVTAFNMAQFDKAAEIVTYKADKALLRKEGESVTLQILLGGKHLIDVSATGMDADAVLKVVDQAFVDRVLAALSS